MPADTIIDVAIPVPLDRTFQYRVPPDLRHLAQPGHRVYVPFGRRRMTGYILGPTTETPVSDLKDILEVLDSYPLWTPAELDFFRWIASYYLHPLAEVLKTALPAGINPQSQPETSGHDRSGGTSILRELFCLATLRDGSEIQVGSKAREILAMVRESGEISSADLRRRFGSCLPQIRRLAELGLITTEEREVYRNPFGNRQVPPDSPRVLNPHQAAALQSLVTSLDLGSFSPYLLYGVTGSGKTEVYLQAIAHALSRGCGALVLVPEISLTPQLVNRFRARFGTGIAVLHSALSDGERYDEWRRIRRGQAHIVIGARSALFAPLENIGIIVVDEEHEGSYKQGDGLRYNARDLALVRGRMEQAVVLLGSATPLATSLHAVEQGRLTLLELPVRVEGRPMPAVTVVPMQGVKQSISPQLAQALDETVRQGEQALVFLNRRGFATFLVCGDCNEPLRCPNCTVTLTYHRQKRQSICHYCDFSVPAPGVCSSCGSLDMKELGAGTERIEHEVKELLPQASVVRMDSDTTSGKSGHDRLLRQMNDGSTDILIGTQMVAKGHDFPGVTLVGVIHAEAGLNMPDFRSSERTYQILSQVIGRAGRGDLPGRVFVQSANPDHYAIQCAINHDSRQFYRQELEFRQETGYPPFSHLALLSLSGTAEKAVEEQASATGRLLVRLKQELKLRLDILGPAPAPLYRLRGRYRHQILIKSPVRSDLRRLLLAWLANRSPVSTVREAMDIDPVDTL